MSLFFKGVGWNIEGKLRKNLRPMKLNLPMLKWGKKGKKIRKKLETSFMDSPGISSKNNQLTWIVSKFVLCGVFFFQVLFVKIILKMMWLRTDYFFFPLHQHLHHREPFRKDYYSQINLNLLAKLSCVITGWWHWFGFSDRLLSMVVRGP